MIGRVEARAPAATARPAPAEPAERVVVRGKFLWAGDRKFWLRGVAYGPFRPAADGVAFPAPARAAADLAAIATLGANTVRTYTVPPRWLLDHAAAAGLRVLIGVPWTQHVCFLDQRAVVAEIRRTVREAVRATAVHPAVLGYLLGNEIPPDVVRWHGPARIARFLGTLYDDAKALAPATPLSYASFPPTEYLDVPVLDFVAFNVYLHREADFRRYLGRLQNLAGDRPLVLAEHGVDSRREGAEVQAAMLAWQVRAAFEAGLAGTCVFAWTDEWFAGGHDVDDWAFGLVTRAREPKPALAAVRAAFAAPLPPALPRWPRVSVVVCAYNAARTIDACLAALAALRYPDYEVVVVNDGSTDATRAITARHPHARVVDQPNRGLSVARNVGRTHADGEVLAYTDADCVVDPDWLTYLVARLVRDGFVAAGGPNLPPPAACAMAAYVAAAPGGPTHVLLNDEVAEHVPGCNMAFTRAALDAVGGFEPVFRTAGDDVDVCWRLQNAGHAIGFSPAAVVWHERRPTARAYLRQQRGYGQAEALLYFRHPYRFNMLGQSRWLGRIYGDVTGSLFARRPIVYGGPFGRGLFQTLYEPASSLLALLPFTLEWCLLAVVLLAVALATSTPVALALAPLAVTVAAALAAAWRAPLEAPYDRPAGRLVLAALTVLGPLVRGFERARWRIRGHTEVARVERAGVPEGARWPRVHWRDGELALAYWTEEGTEKEALLEGLARFLLPRKYLVARDLGWSPWDLEIHRGLAAKARVRIAAEYHGGGKRLLRVRIGVRPSRAAALALAAAAALAVAGLAAAPALAAAAGGVLAALAATVVHGAWRLGGSLVRVLEIVAHEVGLAPAARDA